jgi:glyoxylase-like metal-dependent hydrolase (beta-lactamase superfamily II)
VSPTPFHEVADRCWVARYPDFDVNVTVVAGERGLVVVDTHSSADPNAGVLADVRGLSGAPLVAAVNTHAHFDHVLGNAAFAGAGAELVCHEVAATKFPDAATVPERTFSSALVLDLGDRQVELLHPGRGHTGGDLVVRVPDADVLLAGDLVEESAPPSYGDDSWPLEWPATLDLVLGLLGPDTVVVPGHGAPVDRDFVREQRAGIGQVAETIHGLAARGVPVGQAVATGDWPFDPARLSDAVRRGYAHLPRGSRQLPLA